METKKSTYVETVNEVEAITGAKVVAITKEDSTFNSDFVLLDNNGVITQAFITRNIYGKISVNACYDSNSVSEALAYLNMSDEELAQNIEFVDTDTTPTETEKEETELSNAANLLNIYVDNDGFIYESYTQKAIDAIVNDGLSIESTEVKNHIRNAVNHAAKEVKKYDGLTPTAKDIEHATRLFTEYIIECAQYQIETA